MRPTLFALPPSLLAWIRFFRRIKVNCDQNPNAKDEHGTHRGDGFEVGLEHLKAKVCTSQRDEERL
jgi:hypothetical protein